MSIVFSVYHFLMGPQNSKSLKYWANGEPGFKTGLFHKKLYKGSVCTKPQNGSDIYERALYLKRMNRWIELVFCMLVQIQEYLKLFH